ncbi:hypothetical protein SK128_020648 [Halocaridina rubra]|uniref:Ig-like domain-containing protein n=1 Tax=Halocaridina rubra TaxID=373956 RepID=A0AAN8WS00_HALRR
MSSSFLSVQVQWLRSDGLMPVGRSSVGVDWSLRISSLITEDQGVYVCQATNQAGSHAANTSLLVVEAPRVDGGPRPRIAVITPTHVRKISCPVSATPSPLIFWVKENHPLEESLHYTPRDSEGKGEWSYPGGQPEILVGEDSNFNVGSSDASVDTHHNLHVSSQQEGLWACMATNEGSARGQWEKTLFLETTNSGSISPLVLNPPSSTFMCPPPIQIGTNCDTYSGKIRMFRCIFVCI